MNAGDMCAVYAPRRNKYFYFTVVVHSNGNLFPCFTSDINKAWPNLPGLAVGWTKKGMPYAILSDEAKKAVRRILDEKR